jgi:hypothetical protein
MTNEDRFQVGDLVRYSGAIDYGTGAIVEWDPTDEHLKYNVKFPDVNVLHWCAESELKLAYPPPFPAADFPSWVYDLVMHVLDREQDPILDTIPTAVLEQARAIRSYLRDRM